MRDLAELESRVDAAALQIVAPLRLDKAISSENSKVLLDLGDELREAFATTDPVPRSLVAKVLFIFTQTLTEADHAPSSDRERLLDVAWEWEDRIRQGLEADFNW